MKELDLSMVDESQQYYYYFSDNKVVQGYLQNYGQMEKLLRTLCVELTYLTFEVSVTVPTVKNMGLAKQKTR